MQLIVRLGFALPLLAACSTGERTPPAPDLRARCTEVRDHLVELIAKAYIANPVTTFDGLDRSDPAITEGLDPKLTRDTFGAFLATPAGQAWIARQKQRAIAAPSMTDTVATCTAKATPANIACWLGANNMTAFQLCPPPG